MAALQQRNSSYCVQFNFRGKQRGFTLGRISEAEARVKAAQIDYLLMRLKQGLIDIPTATDIVEFFQHDGRLPGNRRPTQGSDAR
jgi:hypothetical protein